MSKKRANAQGSALEGEVAALETAAAAERKLLRREQQAEARLEAARARLAKAEERYRRRLAEVQEAEAELRARQAARAAGPGQPAPARPAASEPAAGNPGTVLLLAGSAASDQAGVEAAPGEGRAEVLLPDGSLAAEASQSAEPEIVAPGSRRRRPRQTKSASA